MSKTLTIAATFLAAALFAPSGAGAYTISVEPTVARQTSALIDSSGSMAAVDARVASTTASMEPVNFTLFAEVGDPAVEAYFDVPAIGGLQLWFFDGGHWINLANGWKGPFGGIGLTMASAPMTVELYPISDQQSSFEAKVFLRDEEDNGIIAEGSSVITFGPAASDDDDGEEPVDDPGEGDEDGEEPGDGDDNGGSATATAQFDNTATTTAYTLWIPDGSPTTTLAFSTSVSTTTGEATVTLARPLHGMFFVGSDFIEMQVPASATVSASSSWDGSISLPKAATGTTTPTVGDGETASVALAVTIGSDSQRISFDKGVRILFAGQAGKRVGFWEGGSFAEITETCSNDWQSVGDSLAAGGSCKMDVGPDLVVWTKHLTTFVAYTVTTSAGVSNGDNGSTGGSGTSTTTEPFRASGMSGSTRRGAALAAAPTSTVGQGQVLGASTYRFSSNVSQGMSGESVRQLQERLRAEGYFTHPTSTGYFGPITVAAVQMYQSAKGIPATGFVGPLTIAELNKAPVATVSLGEQGVDANLFVELLISLGVIGSDKAMAAREAVAR